MESLETLAMAMVRSSDRYKQSAVRREKYTEEMARREGLSPEQYKEKLRREKVFTMVPECVFGDKDDIVIFTDCWESFGYTPEKIRRQLQRVKEGYAHRHGYFEMFYVLKGYCLNYINFREEVFREGSFCLMNPQVIHERVLPDADSIILTICVQKEVFDSYLLNMLRDIPVFWQFFAASVRNEEQPEAYIHLQDAPNPNFESIIYQILRAYLLDDATSQTIMKCSLVPLIAELARAQKISGFQSTPWYSRAQNQEAIDRILETIRAECETVTLAGLARASSFSPNYLSSLIKKNTGRTFQELVSHYWAEKAKTLLTCTTFSIDEIAELMSASSRGNFERRFKALAGLTPAQYRRQNARTA